MLPMVLVIVFTMPETMLAIVLDALLIAFIIDVPIDEKVFIMDDEIDDMMP